MQNEHNPLLETLSKRLGTTPQELQQSARQEQLQQLLQKLKPADAQKLQGILQNPEAANQLLRSPQAQILLKKLTGG